MSEVRCQMSEVRSALNLKPGTKPEEKVEFRVRKGRD